MYLVTFLFKFQLLWMYTLVMWIFFAISINFKFHIWWDAREENNEISSTEYFQKYSVLDNISLPPSIALHCLWNFIKLTDLLPLPLPHFIRSPLYVGKSGVGTSGQLFYMQDSICQEKHDYSGFEKKFLDTWLTCTTKIKAFRGNQKPLLNKTLRKDNIKRW